MHIVLNFGRNRMRAITLIVFCLASFPVVQVATGQPGTHVNFNELEVGNHTFKFERTKYIVLHSKQEERWFIRSVPEEKYHSSRIPLDIDFDVNYADSIVIGIVRPSPTVDFRVEIDSIVHRGEWLEVYATETRHWARRPMAAHPSAFVKIPKIGLPIEFKDININKLEQKVQSNENK